MKIGTYKKKTLKIDPQVLKISKRVKAHSGFNDELATA